MTVETKYAIGDAVYTASEYRVDRGIIKAIRITGLRNKVEYGFETTGYMSFMIHGDGFSWWSEKDLFDNVKDAEKRHSLLEADRAAKEAKEKADELIKRKARLRAELEQLEAGVDPDEDDE
jgi:hypothetical protein